MGRDPLRVGVNLCWLVPGEVGGTEEYAIRLLAALHGLTTESAGPAGEHGGPAVELTVFGTAGLARAHPWLAERHRLVTMATSGRCRTARVGLEATWLAARSRRHRLELVHHLGGTVPLVRGAPAVVTIHDLQPLLQPWLFSPTKVRWLARMLPHAARSARMVVTVSEHVARQVTHHLGIDPDRVRVVAHGADAVTRPDDAAIDAIAARHGLTAPWFTYPAVTWPHKNHGVLLDALAALRSTHPRATLVLTGGAGPAESEVEATIARNGLDGAVVRTGRIPRAEVDALIAGSAALTFPSTFEGFGAPVLEAMTMRTPVIAADATTLPDVVGDAGVLVAPDRPTDWTRAMADVLDDDDHRHRLISAGTTRAGDRPWSASARRLVAVWQEVAGR